VINLARNREFESGSLQQRTRVRQRYKPVQPCDMRACSACAGTISDQGREAASTMRDRWFESVSLHRRVGCEPELRKFRHRCSGTNYASTISGVALSKCATNLEDVRDAASLNYFSDHRTPKIGQIVVWRSVNGLYAATKVIGIKDDSRAAVICLASPIARTTLWRCVKPIKPALISRRLRASLNSL